MSEIRKSDVEKFTFKEYRKVGTTRLSNEMLPTGTKVETLEGWYTCAEPSRLAIDASGNVYPVAESVFRKSYEDAGVRAGQSAGGDVRGNDFAEAARIAKRVKDQEVIDDVYRYRDLADAILLICNDIAALAKEKP